MKANWNLVLFFALLLSSLSGLAQFKSGLAIGDKIPHFKAYDQYHEYISESGILAQHDGMVLFFYRGNWCSYCRKQLAQLQDSLKMITDKNYQVVVVTPEKPESIDQMTLKTGATFSILYDRDYSIMKAFEVDFKISDETVPGKVKSTRSNARKANGNNDDMLPVPAVYIVAKNRQITWRHFDPDYSKRPSILEILSNL